MYRRAIFESVGGFDTSLRACEDFDMHLRIARQYPVCNHERVVAEYRRHGASMSRNPALMLNTSMAVLRTQHKHIRGHKQYQEAHKADITLRQWNYGDRLVDEIRVQAKERVWKRVLVGMLVLLRCYPRGLALLLLDESHMKRSRLARRLLIRKQEPEAEVQRR